jgi:hypothetical protein
LYKIQDADITDPFISKLLASNQCYLLPEYHSELLKEADTKPTLHQ